MPSCQSSVHGLRCGQPRFLYGSGVKLAHAAPLMIVGNDEKLLWDDNGKPIISPAGKECRYGSANFFTQEVAYLDQYRREYEITKRVSVRQVDPLALIQLRQTGAPRRRGHDSCLEFGVQPCMDIDACSLRQHSGLYRAARDACGTPDCRSCPIGCSDFRGVQMHCRSSYAAGTGGTKRGARALFVRRPALQAGYLFLGRQPKRSY
jgi:hypothetical protein